MRSFDLDRRLLLKLLGALSIASPGARAAQSPSLQDLTGDLRSLPTATIFTAREIITMDPVRPRVEAVAVINGRIAAVGRLSELKTVAGDQPFTVDETFADKVLIAGFVEQHVHPVLSALTMMASAVISIEDWDTVTGFSRAVRDEQGYRQRLQEALAAFDDKKGTFLTWGYHHYFHGSMSRSMLDQLAPDVPIVVWHRSAHEVFLNSKALEAYNINAAWLDTFTPSQKDQTDLGNGHFYEQGMLKALERLAPAMATPERLNKGLAYTKAYYLQQGITVCCEPGGFYSKPL